jgi:hypothetical protein
MRTPHVNSQKRSLGFCYRVGSISGKDFHAIITLTVNTTTTTTTTTTTPKTYLRPMLVAHSNDFLGAVLDEDENLVRLSDAEKCWTSNSMLQE